jgi:hypothetical protein
MNRGGVWFLAAGCVFYLLGGLAPQRGGRLQGSETESATAAVSDFYLSPAAGTGTGTPAGTPPAIETEIGTTATTLLPTEAESATAVPTATCSESETPTPVETETIGQTITPTTTLTSTETETAGSSGWTPVETETAGTPGWTTAETGTLAPTLTPTLTPSPTPSPTPTPTPTATPSPPETAVPRPAWVVISEVAWAGTSASANDEWIELWNPGDVDVDLTGWTLTDNGDIRVALAGSVGAGGFFLLERTDDTTVGGVAADQIYTGALSNAGERLYLIDGSGVVMDSANADGGAWPAGGYIPFGTMERINPGTTADAAWCGNDGVYRNGSDANGNPVNGTPRQPFSGHCLAPTPSPTRTPTVTSTPTESQTATVTPTATPTSVATAYPPGSLILNEVAWGGTAADSSDEWIELWNPGAAPIDLAGWRLTDGGDVNVYLSGVVDGGGYFLLERGGDDTLSDIPAGQLYTGGLSNAGEELLLIDPAGAVIDAAGSRGGWPAGGASPAYASMERAGRDPATWASNNGWTVNGRDADGNPVRGTPGRANSILFPTPTRTKAPHSVVINEFLPKPGSDWNRDGRVDYDDEFIELYNTGTVGVDLGGWMLDDNFHGGSRRFVIPGGTWINPHQYLVFFRIRTHIALNDGGDEVWLLSPDGAKIDGAVYTRTRWPDSGWDRFPDGAGVLRLGFPPTPGEPNRLPDDILNPKENPPPVIAGGWRRVMCGPDAGPLPVGAGFLTTGSEGSVRAAESNGWYQWWNGKCYAWTDPDVIRWLPDSNLEPDPSPGIEGFGWWWKWWYLR